MLVTFVGVGTLMTLLDKEILCIYSLTAIPSVANTEACPL